MIISESIIQLQSERTAVERHQQRESLTAWQEDEEPRVTRGRGRGYGREITPGQELKRLRRDSVSLEHQSGVRRRQVQPAEMEVSKEQRLETDLNVNLLRSLFERITGRRFQIMDPTAFTSGSGETAQVAPEVPTKAVEQVEPVADSGAGQESVGYGLAYDYHESHYEYEKTEVSAAGIIKTADGKQIDFSMSVSMSREFYSEESISLRAGDALKDPLVVNFGGKAAELTQREFAFDIDSDGHQDQIAFVDPSSGFLALDKNEDGIINDGSELFGATSGDGFADLKAYDSDGNNWIDENDTIFDKLRIWSKNSQGIDQLVALGKAGVGALYLGHIESAFAIKDTENNLLGQVRETGLAVMESGEVVSMQQVDLVA